MVQSGTLREWIVPSFRGHNGTAPSKHGQWLEEALLPGLLYPLILLCPLRWLEDMAVRIVITTYWLLEIDSDHHIKPTILGLVGLYRVLQIFATRFLLSVWNCYKVIIVLDTISSNLGSSVFKILQNPVQTNDKALDNDFSSQGQLWTRIVQPLSAISWVCMAHQCWLKWHLPPWVCKKSLDRSVS